MVGLVGSHLPASLPADLRVGLGQINVIPGRPARNVKRMLEVIAQARARDLDVVAFPEMCVGGYLLGDRWLEDEFCADLMEYNDDLRRAAEDIVLIYGNVYYDAAVLTRGDGWHPNKDGRARKYNAVYVIQDGKYVLRDGNLEPDVPPFLPAGVQPKTLLPNYRIFDDERYYFSTRDVALDFPGVELEALLHPFTIEVRGQPVKLGVEVCEDLWCADYRLEGRALNPTRYLVAAGAQLVINISASPWTYGKNDARDRRVQFLHDEIGSKFVPFLYVNNTGAQNNGKNVVTFDGGTTAYNARGEPVKFAREAYAEELVEVASADLTAAGQPRVEPPMIAQKYTAIITGIRHVRDLLGWENHPTYVVGVSGGVDSAVVAALLVQAVGRDHVLTVNMPTRFNAPATRASAEALAAALDVPYLVVPIEPACTAILEMLEAANFPGNARPLTTLHRENVQAKVRGTSVLSNLAAKYGGVFTNNGNKLEIALGYATLYGDVGGAVAPIGDLTKAEVFEMARYLNGTVYGREVVPEALLPDPLFRFNEGQIAPSAELKEAQVDPMKFGYHDAVLEAMTDFKKKSPGDLLQWFLEGSLESHLGIPTALLDRWGLRDPATFVRDLEWFVDLFQRNIFKRVQAPPIVITSKSAFGYDIRESQLPPWRSRRYQRLKDRVVAGPAYEPRA